MPSREAMRAAKAILNYDLQLKWLGELLDALSRHEAAGNWVKAAHLRKAAEIIDRAIDEARNGGGR